MGYSALRSLWGSEQYTQSSFELFWRSLKTTIDVPRITLKEARSVILDFDENGILKLIHTKMS